MREYLARLANHKQVNSVELGLIQTDKGNYGLLR